MKKCVRCNGNKTILGMGAMRVKCHECKGIGFMMETKKEDVVKVRKPRNKEAPKVEAQATG